MLGEIGHLHTHVVSMPGTGIGMTTSCWMFRVRYWWFSTIPASVSGHPSSTLPALAAGAARSVAGTTLTPAVYGDIGAAAEELTDVTSHSLVLGDHGLGRDRAGRLHGGRAVVDLRAAVGGFLRVGRLVHTGGLLRPSGVDGRFRRASGSERPRREPEQRRRLHLRDRRFLARGRTRRRPGYARDPREHRR